METTFKKDFRPEGVHIGAVKKHIKGSGWHHVECPDGDSEDLRLAEFAHVLGKEAVIIAPSASSITIKPGHEGAEKGLHQYLWERLVFPSRGK
jgi:hypothetical protein